MMYISVFPIAISMRRTNVYEEKSLGIYGETTSETEGEGKEPSYVGAHLRRQLSFDLWYVFLGLFLIAIIDGSRLANTNEYAFSLFSVLFEIISAYGTVGLSLGYPTANTSFVGQFKTLSKLVIIAMQIRGRHRGLPYELDRAVLLPSESLHQKETVEADRMLARRRTSLSDHSKSEHSRPRSPAPNQSLFSPFSHSHRDHPTAPGPAPGPAPVSNKDMIEKLTDPEGLHDEKPSGPIRSGLGNAMFRLAAPLHKTVHEGDNPKQD